MNIIDLHCDYLSKSKGFKQITPLKLAEGKYMAQCFAIYTAPEISNDEALENFNRQLNKFNLMLKEYSNIISPAFTRTDILNNFKSNRISALLTVENAEFLNNNIDRISLIVKNNVRILGIIHNGENCLGYPNSGDKVSENLPLKKFGRETVESLNSTKTFIDVSHLNIGGFNDVINISENPVIATHSACRNIVNNQRNLFDWQIRAIAESGGIVGVPFYSKFLNGTNKTDIADIIYHISHLINIGGSDIAALGSDFDGIDCKLFIDDCSQIQLLTDSIIKTFGYSVAEKICYKNVLNILC